MALKQLYQELQILPQMDDLKLSGPRVLIVIKPDGKVPPDELNKFFKFQLEKNTIIKEYSEMNRYKEILNVFSFFVILSAPILMLAIFLAGAKWAMPHLIPTITLIGWLLLAIDIVIFLPLSIFKKLRFFTGISILLSSYIFGLIEWLYSFIFVYYFWGMWAVILGLCFIGIGCLPMALLITALNGNWQSFIYLITIPILGVFSRVIGCKIAASYDRQ